VDIFVIALILAAAVAEIAAAFPFRSAIHRQRAAASVRCRLDSESSWVGETIPLQLR